MADLWPDPVPGAPCTSRSLALPALGVAARETADFARSMVPTGHRRAPYDGALVADALRLRELTERVLAAAVVVEREDGTDWPEIADTLHVDPPEAQQRWDDVVDHWRQHVELTSLTRHASLPGPDVGDGPSGGESSHDDRNTNRGGGTNADAPTVPIEPEQVARELDDWVLRHREPLDPINGSTPSPTASSGCTLHWN